MLGGTVKNGVFSDSEEDAMDVDCCLDSIDNQLPKIGGRGFDPRLPLFDLRPYSCSTYAVPNPAAFLFVYVC